MLTEVNEVPPVRPTDARYADIRAFAEKTVMEFVGDGYEAAKVSGAPDGYKKTQIVGQLKSAVYRLGYARTVKVSQRGSAVYLRRA